MISRYMFNSERIQEKKKKKPPTREVSEKNSEKRPPARGDYRVDHGGRQMAMAALSEIAPGRSSVLSV